MKTFTALRRAITFRDLALVNAVCLLGNASVSHEQRLELCQQALQSNFSEAAQAITDVPDTDIAEAAARALRNNEHGPFDFLLGRLRDKNVVISGYADYSLFGSLLSLAVSRRDVYAVDKLLREGADANRRDIKDDNLPIHHIANARRASPGASGELLAEYGEMTAIIQLLLGAGSSVHAYNAELETPLTRAFANRNTLAALALMECGANVSGYEIGHCARSIGAQDWGDFGFFIEGVMRNARLLDQAISPSAMSEDGDTLLHVAAQYGTVASCRVLVEGGFSPVEANHSGDSPIDVAIECGRHSEAHQEIAAFLMSARARAAMTRPRPA